MTVYPDYYSQFKCIAGACKHSCCIGWEIDIDTQSYKRFMAERGSLGQCLRENIRTDTDEPCFKMGEDERCPFLNSEGLCDLILQKDEDFLCDICREHPRFYNFLPGRTEVGLGLACEAAGTLILGQRAPVRFVSEGEETMPEEPYNAILGVRQRVLDMLTDRSELLKYRVIRALEVFKGKFDPTVDRWCQFLLGLERLDEKWTELLEKLSVFGDDPAPGFDLYMADRTGEYEQLMVYTVYRHFVNMWEEGEPSGGVLLAVFFSWLIYKLGAMLWSERGEFTFSDQVELCRLLSSEIEYSDENLWAIAEKLVE